MSKPWHVLVKERCIRSLRWGGIYVVSLSFPFADLVATVLFSACSKKWLFDLPLLNDGTEPASPLDAAVCCLVAVSTTLRWARAQDYAFLSSLFWPKSQYQTSCPKSNPAWWATMRAAGLPFVPAKGWVTCMTVSRQWNLQLRDKIWSADHAYAFLLERSAIGCCGLLGLGEDVRSECVQKLRRHLPLPSSRAERSRQIAFMLRGAALEQDHFRRSYLREYPGPALFEATRLLFSFAALSRLTLVGSALLMGPAALVLLALATNDFGQSTKLHYRVWVYAATHWVATVVHILAGLCDPVLVFTAVFTRQPLTGVFVGLASLFALSPVRCLLLVFGECCLQISQSNQPSGRLLSTCALLFFLAWRTGFVFWTGALLGLCCCAHQIDLCSNTASVPCRCQGGNLRSCDVCIRAILVRTLSVAAILALCVGNFWNTLSLR